MNSPNTIVSDWFASNQKARTVHAVRAFLFLCHKAHRLHALLLRAFLTPREHLRTGIRSNATSPLRFIVTVQVPGYPH